MSWEKMVPEEKSCWCGKGTITYITEMDDWNRIRTSREINCPVCRENERVRLEEQDAKKQKRVNLHRKAQKLAESRYLDKWLNMYEGLNKKEAWLVLTGGDGYPALGTFYKYVKEEGLNKYLYRHFCNHFEEVLKIMKVKDQEIETLLHEENRI